MKCKKCKTKMFKNTYGWNCLVCDWGFTKQEAKEIIKEAEEEKIEDRKTVNRI